MLRKEEKEQISQKIKTLEKASSAELVAVFSPKSSDYKYVSLLISILVIFFVSVILVLLSFSSVNIVQIQLLLLLFILIFFDSFSKIIIKLLPKSYKQNMAKENAQKQFFNLGLKNTLTRQGIMFFVSFEEKYVQILCDEGISQKISDEYWQKIVDDFILDVKKGDLSQGYLKAISSCSDILIENFPIQSDDKNELSDEVRELKI